MKYLKLFELRIEHGYYGGPCPAVSVVPSAPRRLHAPQVDGAVADHRAATWVPATAQALANHRLVAKPRSGAIEVLVPDGGGGPLIALEGLSLSFELRVDSADFALVTDLPPLPGPNGQPPSTWHRNLRPTYENRQPVGSNSAEELELSSGEADVPPGVLAYANVGGIGDDWRHAPRQFTVTFEAKRARWAYYVVTAGKQKPTIVEDTGLLKFESLASAQLVETDEISDELAKRYPDLACYRVLSTLPVPCRRRPEFKLKLKSDAAPSSTPGDGDGSTHSIGPAEPSMSVGPWLAFPSIESFSEVRLPPEKGSPAYPCLFRVLKQ